MIALSPEAQRVLGCLLEKEAFTPDAYPLTLNSLVLGCNQASNRDPIVSYDDSVVLAAIQDLRDGGLARVVHSASYRSAKYRHVAGEVWALTSGELAVVAVLLLRGPQTVNELRTRTERYASDVDDLGGVEAVLDRLAAGKEQPFVIRLGRQPGQREERWGHLLGPQTVATTGEAPEATAEAASPSRSPEMAPRMPSGGPDQTAPASPLEQLAADIRALRDELGALRLEVEELRQGLAKGSETQTFGNFR